MKIDSFNIVYEKNRGLDKEFLDMYGNSDDIVLKNKNHNNNIIILFCFIHINNNVIIFS